MISIKISINNNALGLQNLMQILDDLRGCVSLNAQVMKGRKKLPLRNTFLGVLTFRRCSGALFLHLDTVTHQLNEQFIRNVVLKQSGFTH
jgi:hypothetical protein